MQNSWQSSSTPTSYQQELMPVFDNNPRFSGTGVSTNGSFQKLSIPTLRYYSPRLSREVKVAILFAIGGLVLTLCAFGFKNCLWAVSRIADLLSVCLTPHGFALTAFTSLGVLCVVAAFWTWAQIEARYSYVQIGSFVMLCGFALGVFAWGSSHYDVQIAIKPLFWMWVACIGLLFVGGSIASTEQPQSTAGEQARSNRSQANTIYGDARGAYDYEIDQAARGHTGGFAPMFED